MLRDQRQREDLQSMREASRLYRERNIRNPWKRDSKPILGQIVGWIKGVKYETS